MRANRDYELARINKNSSVGFNNLLTKQRKPRTSIYGSNNGEQFIPENIVIKKPTSEPTTDTSVQ